MRIPSDERSLLVPVHVDAWVVDMSNQEAVAWYLADYQRLGRLASPIAPPFDVSGDAHPAVGIHLHWALPDALTHGRAPAEGEPIVFPFVPNRWMVARFKTAPDGTWLCQQWVVHSDYLTAGGVAGTSPFLDPMAATGMQVVPGGPTAFTIRDRALGRSYTIDAWQDVTPEPIAPFLRAIGPGNVAFAAYAPFVGNVFSFVDTDVPVSGVGAYTYLVVGWYGDASIDPLCGVTMWNPDLWPVRAAWEAQTPAERFAHVLSALRWSIDGDVPVSPPSTSLYHSVVVDVQWPCTTLGNAGIDPSQVRVAVGNSGADALATLIQSEATARANADPSERNAWLAAGDTLAELIQTMLVDAIDDLEAPGGAVLAREAIERSWFGSKQGGTQWEVVGEASDGGASLPGGTQLTGDQAVALATQLAALNAQQRACDENARSLASLQAELYFAWWALGKAGSFVWGETPQTNPPFADLRATLEGTIYPTLQRRVQDALRALDAQRAALPDPADDGSANAWANRSWPFPVAETSGTTTLAGLGLRLKANALPPFWHPTDPTVLIAGLHRARKHGEDGRSTVGGTLRCRLPGQIVTGLHVAGRDVTLAHLAEAIAQADVRTDGVPAVPGLVAETWFADPANAAAIARASGLDAATIAQAIEGLLDDAPGDACWLGTAPIAFALARWRQAWSPLFLEWEVHYHPTLDPSAPSSFSFSPSWRFDGERYAWTGKGFGADAFEPYKGRTIMTPFAVGLYARKLRAYLERQPGLDASRLDELVETLTGWDVLTQAVGGWTNELLTRRAQETFAPPTDDPVGALISAQYHAVPALEGSGRNVKPFSPVRGGFIRFARLQVVDAFGQTYGFRFVQGSEPIISAALRPTIDPDPSLLGSIQVPPRVVQPARLDMRFLAADGSADVTVSPNPEAICGWLVPNHLDRAIAVYDAAGAPLGELIAAPAPRNWRPAPGPAGAPAQPGAIANAALRAVVESIAAQPATIFIELLTTIDETLWTIDPLGGRKDQFLSVLIGRPLAVVQLQLGLRLFGEPACDQRWDALVSHQPPYTWTRRQGEIDALDFPIRLGSIDRRDDGVIGYFHTVGADAYTAFYAVHVPQSLDTGDRYVRPIIRRDGPVATYTGEVYLRFSGAPVTLTMLLDPRGAVHGATGILPVTSARLAPHLVEDLVRDLAVTFRSGPMLADAATLRIPKPAEHHGVWTWVARTASGWSDTPIVDEDARARFAHAPPQLRDGWLRLSYLEEDP